jgi:hypothetical protein
MLEVSFSYLRLVTHLFTCTYVFYHARKQNKTKSLCLYRTLIKKKIKFSSYIYKDIKTGAVAKSYIQYEEGLPNMYVEMRKNFSHI